MAEESRLQSKILKDLRSDKLAPYVECFKVMKVSENGIPDVFFTTALTGAVFIEVKGPQGVPSPAQKYKIKRLNECGCKAFLVYNWEEWWKIKTDLGMMDYNFETLRNAHEDRKRMLSEP